jgi:glutamate/tyrosine decarboxylase-like PLP-dependent enzyme
MANFTSMAAARDAVLRRVGYNVEEEGLIGAPPVNIVLGAEEHITIYSSMRMLGFGTRALRKVDADEQGRMRADSLRALLAGLEGPGVSDGVVGAAGTQERLAVGGGGRPDSDLYGDARPRTRQG